MQLQIDALGDIIALSSGVAGCTYAPQPPEGDAEVVAETAEVLLRTTQAQALELTRRLDRAFALARELAQRPGGGRVYVQYRAHSGLTLARSEILDGRVALAGEPRLRDFRFTSPIIRLDVSFLRRAWWEAEIEEVPLANSTTSHGTGGRTVNNRHDVALQNWVETPSAHFAADALAPASIFSLTTPTDRVLEQWFVGVNHGAIFNPLIEAEARLYGQHSVVSVSGASGGAVLRIALGANGQKTVTWSLDAARVQAIGGRVVKALLRQAGGANAQARLNVMDVNGKVLWSGENKQLRPLFGQFCDLGNVQIPPGGEAQAPGLGGVNLHLELWGSGELDLDYLFLLPQDGGYMMLDTASLSTNNYIEISESPPYAGAFSSANQMITPLWFSSLSLLRRPATARIYSLAARDSGAWPTDSYTLRLFVRRRRRIV